MKRRSPLQKLSTVALFLGISLCGCERSAEVTPDAHPPLERLHARAFQRVLGAEWSVEIFAHLQPGISLFSVMNTRPFRGVDTMTPFPVAKAIFPTSHLEFEFELPWLVAETAEGKIRLGCKPAGSSEESERCTRQLRFEPVSSNSEIIETGILAQLQNARNSLSQHPAEWRVSISDGSRSCAFDFHENKITRLTCYGPNVLTSTFLKENK